MIVHGDCGMKNKKRLEFWKGKKVFITGHTGFKGAWLAYVLKSLGAKVYGYSLESNNKFNLFNSNSLYLPVSSGQLVLFPSYLEHSVPVLKENVTRISLSFNTFIIGDINKSDAISLKI